MPSATWTLTATHAPTAAGMTPSPTSKTPSPTATGTEPTATPTRPKPSPPPSPTAAETGLSLLAVRVERREGEDPIEGAKVLVYIEEEVVAFDAKTDAEGLARFELRPDTAYKVFAEHDDFYGRFWEDAERWEDAKVIELAPDTEEEIRIRLNPRVPPEAPPVSIEPWATGR